MDRGAWWAIVHMVTNSRTRLKQLNTHTYIALLLLIRHFYIVCTITVDKTLLHCVLFIMEAIQFCNQAIYTKWHFWDLSNPISQISVKTGVQVIINKHVYTSANLMVFVYSNCASLVRWLLLCFTLLWMPENLSLPMNNLLRCNVMKENGLV